MIRLKTLIEQSQPPEDKIIDIKGSEPYYTVIYRHNGKNYKIEFEDYELMDRVDEYGWTGEILGVDQDGGEWSCYANAVTLGGGDYDWDVDWDQIEYQGKPKTKDGVDPNSLDWQQSDNNYQDSERGGTSVVAKHNGKYYSAIDVEDGGWEEFYEIDKDQYNDELGIFDKKN